MLFPDMVPRSSVSASKLVSTTPPVLMRRGAVVECSCVYGECEYLDTNGAHYVVLCRPLLPVWPKLKHQDCRQPPTRHVSAYSGSGHRRLVRNHCIDFHRKTAM